MHRKPKEKIVLPTPFHSARLALLAVMLAASSLNAQSQTPAPPFDVVVVSGESVLKSAPDRAWVTISVESRAKQPRDAQRQNAETMTAVQGRLRKAG
ncbi:MAG: SIMPL domain-containing protein, partial [Vicinamibacterales bacterium]